MPQWTMRARYKTPLRHLSLAYALMALSLVSCSSLPGSSAQAGTTAPQVPMLYGSEGSLTSAELATLQGLAWPQQYEDMVGSFGFPYYRSATADYYQIQGSTDWVVIYYSGRSATGFGFEAPPAAGGAQ